MFSRSRVMVHLIATICVLVVSATALAQRLTTRLVATGLDKPVLVTTPPGDMDRLFVLEQNTGLIRIIKNGTVLPTPFLDLSDRVYGFGTEQGLLGLVFHPQYESNGYFFVLYSDQNWYVVVERFTASVDDPDVADPTSDVVILNYARNFIFHHGGMMQFGPNDGNLYIATGEGGLPDDPDNFAQRGDNLLGKILRIDVDGQFPYEIPPDNPFVDDPDFRDEIWHYGLRNPWRFHIDPVTSDMYIGDVGKDKREEIDVALGQAEPGLNFGWRIKQGTLCNIPPVNCDPNDELVDPIFEYSHSTTSARCAVIGGVVYRGASMPLLQGTYFFGDYCSAEIGSLVQENGELLDVQNRTDELQPEPPQRISLVSSFGVDATGEVYICDLVDGDIYRIETQLSLAASDLVAGNDASFEVSGARPDDVVFLAYSTIGTGATPIPPLNTTAAILEPVAAGFIRTDGDGAGALRVAVPDNAQGTELWLQVIELNNSSNVVRRVVQ